MAHIHTFLDPNLLSGSEATVHVLKLGSEINSLVRDQGSSASVMTTGEQSS